MSANIFVSYASNDVKVAMTLCNALENRGFMCWIAARDIQPGENFQVAIVQAIRKAKILLLVFTGASNTSEEMTKELALASQHKMIVIPLRIEDVAPSDAFAYEFATRQWIDFFADWEFAIEQLTRRIGQALLERSAGIETNQAVDAIAEVIAAEKAEEVAPDPASLATSPLPAQPAPLKAEAAAANAEIHSVKAAAAARLAKLQADLAKEELLAEPAKITPLAASANDRPKADPAPASVGGSSQAKKIAAIVAALVVLTGLGLALPKIIGGAQKGPDQAEALPAHSPATPALPIEASIPPPPIAATPAPTTQTASTATPKSAAPAAVKPVSTPKKQAAPKVEEEKVDIPF